MKKFLSVFALPFLLTFLWFNSAHAQDGAQIGQDAPAFTLKNIDGKMVSLSDYSDSKGVIVVFTCNHCPYSKLYEDRLIGIQDKWGDKGFPVVAINPNDAEQYPEDSYKEMKKRAKAKKFNFPYLHDESQAIAQAYGATRTPHIFVVKNHDGKSTVEYVGAIDDNPKDAEMVDQQFLDKAIEALLKNEAPTPNTTKAIGCSIKWKKV